MFLAFGLWNIYMALSVYTPNMQSTIMFKFIPFIGGSYLVLVGLKQYGLI